MGEIFKFAMTLFLVKFVMNLMCDRLTKAIRECLRISKIHDVSCF